MNIQEILAEVDERYQNGISALSKITKINKREKELFRTVYRKKTATMMDVVSGQFLYPLDFSKSKIIHVIVDGTRYAYEEIDNSDANPPFLYTYENALGLYPTPDRDITGGLFIHHYAEPKTYTSISETPGFDSDFHMVHVYGLCAELAEIDRQYDVSRYFDGLYRSVLEEFKKANPEPELPPMRVE